MHPKSPFNPAFERHVNAALKAGEDREVVRKRYNLSKSEMRRVESWERARRRIRDKNPDVNLAHIEARMIVHQALLRAKARQRCRDGLPPAEIVGALRKLAA